MPFDIYDEMGINDESTKKRRKYSEKDEQPTNGLDCLPQEVTLDIISRLPVTSLIQFGFVCKSREKLSYDPNLVSMHLSKALNSDPYLIFHCDFPIKNLLFFVEFSHHDGGKDKVRKFEIPFCDSMPEFNVVGSCNGILCLVNSLFDDALYLYNPFTSKYKELPKPTIYQDQQVIYGFGFHPMTNQYKVIKIAYYKHTCDMNTIFPPARRFMFHQYLRSDVQVFCLGSNRWRSIGRMPYQLDRRGSTILLNGRFHWTTNYGNYLGRRDRLIVSFDLSDEVFREVPGPEFDSRVYRRNYHLASLGGCLCIAVPVLGSYGSLEIWVMKEYNMKESWVKEFNIGAFSHDPIQDLQKSRGIWRNILTRRIVKVLCLLKNGEILLEYKGGFLVSYNPENGLFNSVILPKMPKLFQTFLHVGSLNWINA